jgi:hypothetical protein
MESESAVIGVFSESVTMAWLIVSEDCISEEGVAGGVLIVSDKAVSSLSVSGDKTSDAELRFT